jgi:hypothetical protein
LILTAVSIGCALGGSRIANAQTVNYNPACRQTPGTDIFEPLHLVNSHLSQRTSVIQIQSANTVAQLERRVELIVLVPSSGSIEVTRPLEHYNFTIGTTLDNARQLTRMTLRVPLPPPGVYRVLIEDREANAPVGCDISTIELLGNVTVDAPRY